MTASLAHQLVADPPPRKRVLIVSYHFPPVGGAGVQRPVKLARYLRQFGWDASILAAKNPSVPTCDTSLLRDVPSDAIVLRTRTLEPGYASKRRVVSAGEAADLQAALRRHAAAAVRAFAGTALQPDPQILWTPTAALAGARLLDLVPHHAILATAPSYSNLLLGAWLHKRTGLPLVLDFRDEWDLSAMYLENRGRDALSRYVQQLMQSWVLKHAAAIVATTQASTRALADRARGAAGEVTALCIHNGYDPVDLEHATFAAPVPPKERGTFRLVYAGTLWNLTDPSPLVRAIERLDQRGDRDLRRLEVVIVGRKTAQAEALVDRIGRTSCRLRVHDYCEHTEALAWMASADALCVLLSDSEGADRVVPGKLFECLGTGKELLAIVPPGEARDLVTEHGAGTCLSPSDVDGVEAWLSQRLDGVCFRPRRTKSIARFTRIELARRFAELLDQVAAEHETRLSAGRDRPAQFQVRPVN